jgi:hypothetical protein
MDPSRKDAWNSPDSKGFFGPFGARQRGFSVMVYRNQQTATAL